MKRKLYLALIPVLLTGTITSLFASAWFAAVFGACSLLALATWMVTDSPLLATVGSGQAVPNLARRRILRALGFLPFASLSYFGFQRNRWISFGRTVLMAENKPCVGAEVLAVGKSQSLPLAESQTTDGSGHFHFPRLQRDEYRFFVMQCSENRASTLEFTRELSISSDDGLVGGFPQASGEMIVSDPIYFETAEWDLSDADAKDLAGAVIAKLPRSGGVAIIEGHTDENGKADYNFDLGWRRAKTIAQIIATTTGVKEIILISYGKTRLVESGPKRQNWKNRRVVIRVMPKGNPAVT